ncbi:MAG: MBL fold metallo-hydrolase [Desulfovibrio sp.]|jgi:ribonuclease J|nr:MBL fold metallo-hydrolase [Desulfovibrio sp.]
MSDVKLCIHRAADTIGGNCIEIAVPSGERILLDAGRPLDTPDDAPTPIPASLDIGGQVLGVLLSHAHTDHCGLLGVLPASWPVFCGEATEVLLNLSAVLRKESIRQQCTHWRSGKALSIGPFTITPYLIDHSAFDAYALQIDVGGKRILYSGDFRAHGRKATLTKELIKNPPKNLDVLIMEGTNLPASGTTAKGTATEAELEEDFVRLFKESKGRIFVSWSSTNIDRTVTLYRACIRSGRVLVPDLFCVMVLMRLGKFAKIPQPDWEGGHMRAVVTSRMKYLAEPLGEPDIVDNLKKYNAAMSAARLDKTPEKWVIMTRNSLVDDFIRKGVMPNKNDVWVWSQWKGYLEQESSQKMKDFFVHCPMEYIHSSGHASPDVLQLFAESMRPKILIPVHGEAWREHKALFSNIQILQNGDWLEL